MVVEPFYRLFKRFGLYPTIENEVRLIEYLKSIDIYPDGKYWKKYIDKLNSSRRGITISNYIIEKNNNYTGKQFIKDIKISILKMKSLSKEFRYQDNIIN